MRVHVRDMHACTYTSRERVRGVARARESRRMRAGEREKERERGMTIFYRRDLDFVFFAHSTGRADDAVRAHEGFIRGSVTARGENGVMKREKGEGRGAARPLSGGKSKRKNEVGRCAAGTRECVFRLVIIERARGPSTGIDDAQLASLSFSPSFWNFPSLEERCSRAHYP